jgi:hypothetical protein
MLGVVPGAASAQQDPYAPKAATAVPDERTRVGLAFGFGVGGGDIVCESEADVCDGVVEAGGFDLHGLYMLQQKLGLIFDIWVMAHNEDRFTLSQTITTFGARYWLMPRLWIQAGFGGAHARASYDGPLINISDRTDSVPGLMAGVGFEVLTRRSFALDLQLKGGTGFYDDESTKGRNLWFGLGFTWY